VVYIIILFSFIASAIISLIFLNQRNNYRQSMILAICINSFILLTSFWLIYRKDDEAMLFGLVHTEMLILIMSLPLITWLNLIIIQLIEINNKNISLKFYQINPNYTENKTNNIITELINEIKKYELIDLKISVN